MCCNTCTITCPLSECTQGSVRVDSNAGGLPIGRVTICLNETWRVICPNGWTDDDASVVCGQLGHPRQGKREKNE